MDIVTMVELVNKRCGGAKRRRRRIWTKMRWKHEEEAEEEDITSSSSSFNQTLRSATRSLILTMVVAVVAFQVRKSNLFAKIVLRAGPRLRECCFCRQGQAEVVSNIRNKNSPILGTAFLPSYV